VALAALAGGVLMVAALAVVWGTLTIAYGADPFPWVAVVVVTAVPSLLLAIGIDMVMRAFRGSVSGYWPIAAVVYVMVILGMVTVLRITNEQYVEQTARMDAACTPADVAVVAGLPKVDGIGVGEPSGDRLGNCTASFGVRGAYAYLGTLSSRLGAAGWSVNEDDLTHRLSATRSEVTVVWVVGAVDDQGVTTIDVSIAPSGSTGTASP
jgi:hypothetical protein